LVGPGGHVTVIEIDPGLAERSRRNLASGWPQAVVVAADGFTYRPEQVADAIIVNAGLPHLSVAWLDARAGERPPARGRGAAGGFFAGFLLQRHSVPAARARRAGRYVLAGG